MESRDLILELEADLSTLESKIDTTATEIDNLTSKADTLDISIAAASGVLTGLIDIFFVGQSTFDFSSIKPISQEDFNEFTMKMARKNGYRGNSLNGAVAKNENAARVVNDDAWKKADGVTAITHHLDDYAHHPTPFGLCCAIFSEIFKIGIFQNSNGKISLVVCNTTPKEFIKGLLPGVFSGLLSWLTNVSTRYTEEKFDTEIPLPIKNITTILSVSPLAIQILQTSTRWAKHLISDFNGSNKTAGAGMGIPGVFMSFLKEICLIPGVNHTPLPKLVNNLYNAKRIDLRDEIMAISPLIEKATVVTSELLKQALPIIINELFVRSFYFVRHLVDELKDKNSFNDVNWNAIIPIGNRTVERMLTVATGAFTTVDILGATAEGIIRSKGNALEFGRQFVTHINFVGIGRFAVSLGTEAVFEWRKQKKKDELLEEKCEILYLMRAKLLYKQKQVWKALENANQSALALLETARQIGEEVAKDLEETELAIEQIAVLESEKINENNPTLAKEIIAIL